MVYQYCVRLPIVFHSMGKLSEPNFLAELKLDYCEEREICSNALSRAWPKISIP